MVCTVEAQLYGLCRCLVILRLGDVSSLQHLLQHHVATLQAALLVPHGIEIGRVLAQAYQQGCLLYGQIFRLLAEICVGGILDTHGIVEEVKLIEIHRHNLLLGEITLQLDGYHPLYRLLHEAFEGAARLLRVELLGQLLGDGTAASGIRLSHDAALHDGTPQRHEVNAGMFVEPFILRSHQCLHHVGVYLVESHADAVLLVHVPCAYHLAVSTIHLRGVSVYGVLQLFHVRHIAYPPIPYKHKHQGTKTCAEQYQEP